MNDVFRKVQWHLKRRYKKVIYFFKILIKPIIEINEVKLVLKEEWSFNVKDHMIRKDYETGEIEIIKNNISKDDKVLEIGTGLGYIATYCAKIIGDINVTSIEANPFLKSYHDEIFQLNNVFPKVVYNSVSNNVDETIFYIDKINFWSSSLIPFEAKKLMKIKVENIDINKLIGKELPTFLIIDVEGYEFELIKQINDYGSISKIQIETHPKIIGQDKIDKMVDLLQESGYELDQYYSFNDQYFLKKQFID